MVIRFASFMVSNSETFWVIFGTLQLSARLGRGEHLSNKETDSTKVDQGHLWMLPANNVLLMLDRLRDQDISERALFRGTNISPRDIHDNDSLLTFEQVIAFITNAARLTTSPGLGLWIGSRETPADWGTLGYAMLSCSSVGEVLKTIMHFHQTAASMTNGVLSVNEGLATLALIPPTPLKEALPTVIEEHMTATKSALELLSETKMPVVRIDLAYKKPDYHRMYRNYFSCPIQFDSPRNQMVFEADYLNTNVSIANPFSARLARQICDDQRAKLVHETDFLSHVRYLILLEGNNFPNAESVAAKLKITSRTLRNRLAHQNTSFQKMLDDTRKQLALSYLDSSRLNVDEIAMLLGFSDRSNFRRAFRKWVGCSPSDYRSKSLSQHLEATTPNLT